MLLTQRENGFGLAGRRRRFQRSWQNGQLLQTTPDVPAGYAAERSRTIGNFCRPVPENGKLLSAEETVKEAVPRLQNTRPESSRRRQRTSPSVFMALVYQIFILRPLSSFPLQSSRIRSIASATDPCLTCSTVHVLTIISMQWSSARLRACAPAASGPRSRVVTETGSFVPRGRISRCFSNAGKSTRSW
jgi:hypothetical protein